MNALLTSVLCLIIGNAGAADLQNLQSLRDTHYHTISSRELARDFHVYVMLPEGYDGEKSYPTVYALDGGNLFPLLASMQRLLRFAEEVPDVILVGIAYGSDTFAGGNFRSTDFTAPSVEREYWGGAGIFQAFLRSELIPTIEENYRTQADRRIIIGQSLGGQFVLYTAQTDPTLFWGHIASNPALHRNLPFFLQRRPQQATSARVFVASGTEDAPAYRKPALEWIARWEGMPDRPFELEVEHLQKHSHMSAPPEAYRLGMRYLFDLD